MSKVQVMDHPLIQHKISYIRREDVGSKEFREIVSEISALMCYEATRDLKLKDVKIQTPICEMTGKELSGKKMAVVPILRAGLGMVDGILSLIPAAKVGHIGLYRDPETFQPIEYFCKLPADCEEREVFVVDPMLATGGSCAAAVQLLKEKGVRHMRLMCIIAGAGGVERMQKEHPDVDLYIGALDERLNEHKYIVPGLGDAGDRILVRNRAESAKRKEEESWEQREKIISAGMNILWELRSCPACGPRIRIRRWDAVL